MAHATLGRLKTLSSHEFWRPISDGQDDTAEIPLSRILALRGHDLAEYCLHLPEFRDILAEFERGCAERAAPFSGEIARRLGETAPGDVPMVSSFMSALAIGAVGTPRFEREREWQKKLLTLLIGATYA